MFYQAENTTRACESLYFPDAPIPHGKLIQLGHIRMVIYEPALEDGYVAGRRAYQKECLDEGHPEYLDEQGYTTVIARYIPVGLSARDAQCWRSMFIIGWSSQILGVE